MPRPSSYTDQVGQEICRRISLGESVIVICNDDDMPHETTVYKWLRKLDGNGEPYHASFVKEYTRARNEQADHGFDEITEICRKMERKEIDPNTGRVMIDAIKWQLGKLQPKKYSDKHLVEHSTAGNKSIKVSFVDNDGKSSE